MKRVVVLLVLVAALASTAWFVYAFVTERAVSTWLAQREAEGWVVGPREVSVTGFPAEFVTRIAPVSLADPDTGLAWTAPHMVLRQSALELGRVEAIWPGAQTLASPFERLEISAAVLTSALDTQPLNDFALNASETRMADLRVVSTAGWQMALARGRLDMIRVAETDATYDLEFDASELAPPEDVARLLDPAGVLPAAIPVVRWRARITFDRAWDLSALERARPQIRQLDLDEWRAEWGGLLLRASGLLDVDAEGRPTGEIAIRAENWEDMLDMATRAGVLAQGLEGTVRTALSVLAGMTGQTENLDATIRFEDGTMYIGPLPLGEAPRLILW